MNYGLSACLILSVLACGEDEPRTLPLKIETKTLPDVHIGQSYDQKIRATGGVPPYMFTVSEGTLPDALELKAETGQVFGLAASPGRAEFSITVTDKEGNSQSQVLSIYVTPDPLQILTTRIASGQEGFEYEETILAQGGISPRTWSLVDGALPTGIALTEEGVLKGTPDEYGEFEFTVQVQDTETSTAQQKLELYLLALNPMVVTTTIPYARQDLPYVTRFMAEGGTAPYSWSVISGTTPAGIGMADDGLMAGTSTESGVFDFVVSVSDSGDRTGQRQFSLTVIEPLSITTTALPTVIRNRLYERQLEARGGIPPYQWSIRSGDLPPGLTLSEDGEISGMTQTSGDYSFSVRVRDNEGAQKLALFDLQVSDRFIYKVDPAMNFPPVCTSTHVSYAVVPINIPDSMEIDDIDVEVDVTYRDRREPAQRDNEKLKLALFAPDGSVTPLCGNGAGIRGWTGCDGGGGIQTTYGSVTQPDRPLEALQGYNPQGEWRFAAVVTKPTNLGGGTCDQSGTINSITISIRDDQSMDDYIYVRGFTKNNLAVEPWIRVGGAGRMNGEIYLTGTVYDVGSNGFPEGGKGDDMPLAAPVTWTFQGPAAMATITPDGHAVSGLGNSPGEGVLIASEPGGLSYTTRLLILPPEWNPMRRNY